jgi:hypothetical protein
MPKLLLDTYRKIGEETWSDFQVEKKERFGIYQALADIFINNGKRLFKAEELKRIFMN